MSILGIELSSVILSQTKFSKILKFDTLKYQNKLNKSTKLQL